LRQPRKMQQAAISAHLVNLLRQIFAPTISVQWVCAPCRALKSQESIL
jgi:hypothetical protein